MISYGMGRVGCHMAGDGDWGVVNVYPKPFAFKIPGLIFGIYLAMNGIELFFIELIRVNNKYIFWGIEATQAEIISLTLFLSGVMIILLRLVRRPMILTKPSNT